MSATRLLNLPNLLSFLRLPLAVIFILTESAPTRALIIVLAAVTDGLDGWLARRLGQQTGAGQLVDPITDKLFVLVAMASMTARGELAPWMVLLLLARDIYTSFAFFIVKAMGWPVRFKARFIGKTVTVLQFSVLIAALLRPDLTLILVIATTIASLVAITDYTMAILAERRRIG